MDIAAGTGSLKKHAQRAHLRDLRRAAFPRPRRRAEAPGTRSEATSTRSGEQPGPTPADFEAFGVAVEVVKLSKDEAAAAGWPVAGAVEDGGP